MPIVALSRPTTHTPSRTAKFRGAFANHFNVKWLVMAGSKNSPGVAQTLDKLHQYPFFTPPANVGYALFVDVDRPGAEVVSSGSVGLGLSEAVGDSLGDSVSSAVVAVGDDVTSVSGARSSSSAALSMNPTVSARIIDNNIPRPPVMIPVMLMPLGCVFRSATMPVTTATAPMSRPTIGTPLKISPIMPVTSDVMANPFGADGPGMGIGLYDC